MVDHTGVAASQLSCVDTVTPDAEARRLRAIMDAVDVGILTIDAATHRITFANRAALTAIRAPGHDVIGSVCHRNICPAEVGHCPITDLGQDVDYAEKVLWQADGGRLPILKSARACMLDGQRQIVESMVDIAARKAFEHALQESEARYRDLFENASDLIYLSDAGGHFSYVNAAWIETLGYSHADAARLTIADIIAPEYRDHCLQILAQLLEGRAVDRVEAVLVAQDGRRIPVEGTVSCRFVDGKAATMRAIFRDISARRRVEQEIIRAKEFAEAAARAKTDFLANMSHEIRTPLNAVIGMSGLLAETDLATDQREYVDTIQTSGEALLAVINDILDFSKIDAGRLEVERRAFDVQACLEEALDMCAGQAAVKGLELAYQVDPAVPPCIEGDVTRVRQIVVNLLNNAVKFTDRGEVVLTVCREFAEATAPAGSPSVQPGATADLGELELHFAVRDTGIGIPAERRERLFQSFSQVDSSTTRRFGGTGLGLAISYRLAQIMGGRMWVESDGVPGRGATFHFTVRARALTDAHRPARAQSLAGKRLLVVDDNSTNRQILTAQAAGWGMSVETCASGPEALALLVRNERFDVGVLDMHMPGMDGQALATVIRFQHDAQALPLILLSSAGHREAAPADLANLFQAYLTKPVKPAQMHDALARVLRFREVQPPEPTRRALDSKMAERLPMRILVAEDNAVNQRLALRVLQKLGYRADVAGNGLEVLAALRLKHFDLVLMDVHMPEMDGLAATRTLRLSHSTGHRPLVVAMTAAATAEDRAECMAAGMDDYLSKPVRVEELQALLERWGNRLVAGQTTTTRAAAAAPPPDRRPVLDAAALADLVVVQEEGEPNLVQEMAGLYLQRTPAVLSMLVAAANAGDAATVARLAHDIKGSSATFGAADLVQACRALEQAVRTGTPADLPLRVARVSAEHSRLCHELASLCQNETSLA
jgi:PAS domain S-box-containing protein